MSNHMMRAAPALLASLLVGFAVTASTVRAEPASAPATADDCLAKPNGPSPQGSHWYYHVDHATKRQCWYLRPTVSDAGQSETRQPRASAAPIARPGLMTTADPPTGDVPSAPSADTSARSVSRNATPPAIWPASPPAIAPTASPTSIESEPTRTGDGVTGQAPTPLLRESTIDAPTASYDAKPVKRTAMGPPATERPALAVMDPTHLPALLGIGLALALIVFGSFAARLTVKLFQRPRRRVALDPPVAGWDAPSFRLDDSPGIVPVMPRRPDITHEMRDAGGDRNQDPNRASPYGTRRDEHRVYEDRRVAHPPEPKHQDRGKQAREQDREAVAVIEHHVRELLLRLRSEPQNRPTRI